MENNEETVTTTKKLNDEKNAEDETEGHENVKIVCESTLSDNERKLENDECEILKDNAENNSEDGEEENGLQKNKRKNFYPQYQIDTTIATEIHGSDLYQEVIQNEQSAENQQQKIQKNSTNLNNVISCEKSLREEHEQKLRTLTSISTSFLSKQQQQKPNPPTQPIEFSYNAFNAVQELLNVYGLSISPNDIVDTFRKQPHPQELHFGGAATTTATTINATASSTLLEKEHRSIFRDRSSVNSLSEDVEGSNACGEFNFRKSTTLQKTNNNNRNEKNQQQANQREEHEEHEDNDEHANMVFDLSQRNNDETQSSSLVASSPQIIDDDYDNINNVDCQRVAEDQNQLTGNGEEEDDVEEEEEEEEEEAEELVNEEEDEDDEEVDDVDEDETTKATTINTDEDCDRGDGDRDAEDDDDDDDDDDSDFFNRLTNATTKTMPEGNSVEEKQEEGNDDTSLGNPNKSKTNDQELKLRNIQELIEKFSMGCFTSEQFLQLTQQQMEEKHLPASVESIKGLTKFLSYAECKNVTCSVENLREHYHCFAMPCLGKVLSRKEEIIRHLKWHKKRNESLNQGFLRFSSSDDCSLTTTGSPKCPHNRKHTHYHCFQPNCDKVYISTSDVQMHSNYHRKDSAIFQEGFQRYRATEKCNADYCPFSGQRTTHFHCRRDSCRYTFKNKADMEKHKTYHIKDLQLARDGFKKFLKTEPCPYERCRFSNVCNHIHCVRDNCFYVLHSSGQLLSHKRKHERMDSEQAYRRFKMMQKAAATAAAQAVAIIGGSATTATNSSIGGDSNFDADSGGGGSSISPLPALESVPPSNDDALKPMTDILPLELFQQLQQQRRQHSKESVNTIGTGSTSHFIPENFDILMQTFFSDRCTSQKPIDTKIKKAFKTEFDSSVSCNASDEDHQQQIEPLDLNFKSQVSELAEMPDSVVGELIECNLLVDNPPHWHCLVTGCDAILLRYWHAAVEHIRMHELSRNAEQLLWQQQSNLMQITSIEGFFNRKRGRPPKNRVVEVYNDSQNKSPQAIFTSFKLEKGGINNRAQSTPAPNTASAFVSNSLSENFSHTFPSPYRLPDNAVSGTVASTTITELPALNYTKIAAPTLSITESFLKCKFHRYLSDEKCPQHKKCLYARQIHFHCAFNQHCTFVAKSSIEIEKHQIEQHWTHTNSETMQRIFEYFERVGGGEGRSGGNLTAPQQCNFLACGLTSLHFHCLKCYAAINEHDDYGIFKHFNSCICVPLTNSRMQYANALSPASTTTSDESKISVVRAAGTYFPQQNGNGNNLPAEEIVEIQPPIKSPSPKKSWFPEQKASGLMRSLTTSNLTLSAAEREIDTWPLPCPIQFCRLKRKVHYHCDICNQGFSDENRLVTHNMRHSKSGLVATKFNECPKVRQGISNGSRSIEPEDLSKNSSKGRDDNAQTTTAAAAALTAAASLQNLHFAQMAFYQHQQQHQQQQPGLLYYYQNFYPALFNAVGNPGTTEISPISSSSTAPVGLEQILIPPHLSPAPVLTRPPTPLTPDGGFPLLFAAAAALSASAAAEATSRNTHTSTRAIKRKSDTLTLAAASPGEFNAFESVAKKLAKQRATSAVTSAAALKNTYKMFKDEPIPSGYEKYRFNEDCNFMNCSYRNHQSHFHCCRKDCYYSFCDKTRFVQHTARHERLDKLMGEDFKQYRANMRCGYAECSHNNKDTATTNNKSSHFHCLKCSFICSDTNKVVAHRRQHNKAEFIRMAGFRKVAYTEKCNFKPSTISAAATTASIEKTSPNVSRNSADVVSIGAKQNESNDEEDDCIYSLKQTHYHCLLCDCTVLAKAQLNSHRH